MIVTRREGIGAYSLLKKCSSGSMQSSPINMKLRSLSFPIAIRPGTADATTIIETVIRQDYSKISLDNNPVWMIDAGAYIGDTAALFLSRYPGLKIIALEPNAESFNAAVHNLEPYGNRVILLNRALWISETEMRFGGASTSSNIRDNGVEVKCISIPALMQQYSIPKIDILKMDIEGAEESVITSKPDLWLHFVDLIILEIHGDSKLRVIADVLRDNGFVMIQYRSVWYCYKSNSHGIGKKH
jgi:FkbM family methyltransferase